MSAEQFTNNATTTLGSSLSSGATTATLAAGTGALFPVLSGSQFFKATLWTAGSTTGVPNEIVLVTARSGDTVTIVRGQEGTTALSWNVGDTFALYPTAAWYNGVAQIGDIQAQLGNFADDTGTANAGAIALSPALTALIPGMPIRVLKTNAYNTGAYTLNVNGLGAVAVHLPGGGLLGPAALEASGIFTVVYDGAVFELQSAPSLQGILQLVTVEITATGAFSIPIPLSVIPGSGYFTATGGGGGAAGATSGKSGGSGGGAGTSQGPIALMGGTNLTGTVGTGGAGGTTGNDGTQGGNTNCGSISAGGGGQGIQSSNVPGGAPGTASGGTVNTSGGNGVDGLNTGNIAPWAVGGASFWGGGGRAGDGAGINGFAPGSGGGSCYGTAGTGGNGAPGIFVLSYWEIL